MSFLGVVQADDADMERDPEPRRQKVMEAMKEHQVAFPTCVHFSSEITRAWHAEGVPLTLVLSSEGVVRVAMGARNGLRLLSDVAAGHNRP